jgi:predicted MPP superfamily phosphohydrolase
MSIGFRLLHLTDFHWIAKTAEDQKLVTRKLLEDVHSLTVDRKVGVIVFSGDLVCKGGQADDFQHAKNHLLDPIRDALALTDNDIVNCPGNHDVDRAAATVPFLETGVAAELINNDALNTHFDDFVSTPIDKDPSCVRLANYFSFMRRYYAANLSVDTNYYSCFIRSTLAGNIGFAAINSAWRSTGVGEAEKCKLLVPERAVDKAADHLSKCILKILVVHHPLDWLAPWNVKAVSIPLFSHFDLVLFGHVHESMPTISQNAIGECLFAQGGCLYVSREYYNGYQLLDIDFDDGVEFRLSLRTWYNQPRRAFAAAENICENGQKLMRLSSHNGQANLLVCPFV